MGGCFYIRLNNELTPIRVADIYYIQALKNYIVIATKKAKYKALLRMSEIEEELSSASFCRVHRSFVIAFDHIESLDEKLVIVGSHAIPIGLSYKEEFFKRLNIIYRKDHPAGKARFTGIIKRHSFFIRTDKRLVQIRVPEICYIEAIKENVLIHTNRETYKVRLSTRQLETELAAYCFQRLHRGYLIALEYIDSISSTHVTVSGREIPFGKNYKIPFLKKLKVLSHPQAFHKKTSTIISITLNQAP